MKKRINLIVILFLVVHVVSFSQEHVPKETFFQKLKDLGNQISILSDAPEGRFRNIITLCNEIVGKAIAYEVTFVGNFSDKHINSLDHLIDFTFRIRLAETKDKEEMALILYKDLSLKFVKEKSPIASIDEVVIVDNKLISVTIVTIKDGKAANNLRVKWAPLGFHTDFNKPKGSFGELTTPAIDQMVPGVYMFWITNDGESPVLNNKEHEVNPHKVNTIEFSVR